MVDSLEIVRLAAGALAANRGRSALTVLSIVIGAFTIVVMSSLAASGLGTMQRGIEELGGARLLLLVPKLPERGEAKTSAYARGFTLADRERVLRDLPHVEGSSMFSRLRKKDVVTTSGDRVSSDLIAADAAFFSTFRMRVARGRAFSEDENRSLAAVCVVGHALEAKLAPVRPGANLLGQWINAGPLRCRVVGILADNDRFGVGFGFSWTDLVIAPSETVAAAGLADAVRERAAVLVQTDAPSSNEPVKRLINARMVARHPGVDDFTLLDFAGVMARFHSMLAVMEVIVALLAGISLLIGGVGVMNMMLVAVSERVTEIGLRKALGAEQRAIRAQFLVEATLLAVLGGAVGVAGGLITAIGASLAIAHFLKTWQLSLAPWAAAAAMAAATLIGAGFGWMPARNAARLDPIVALRR